MSATVFLTQDFLDVRKSTYFPEHTSQISSNNSILKLGGFYAEIRWENRMRQQIKTQTTTHKTNVHGVRKQITPTVV